MKEKLKAVRVEILFFLITAIFLAVILWSDSAAGRDSFVSFSVETAGKAEGSAPESVRVVNINTASIEELEMLPGVGSKLAEEIILWRQENGPFLDKEDLLLVDGVSEELFGELMDVITVKDSLS